MELQSLATCQQASIALQEYKQHRANYDKRDWEIERVYRQIARGKQVISLRLAIERAGMDPVTGFPRLAVTRADFSKGRCNLSPGDTQGSTTRAQYRLNNVRDLNIIFPVPHRSYRFLESPVPRIPPQHRPAQNSLSHYHILWEANWKAYDKDPILLRRFAEDAWLVVAAWDLTDVELCVLRSA